MFMNMRNSERLPAYAPLLCDWESSVVTMASGNSISYPSGYRVTTLVSLLYFYLGYELFVSMWICIYFFIPINPLPWSHESPLLHHLNISSLSVSILYLPFLCSSTSAPFMQPNACPFPSSSASMGTPNRAKELKLDLHIGEITHHLFFCAQVT